MLEANNRGGWLKFTHSEENVIQRQFAPWHYISPSVVFAEKTAVIL
jgi:hypothetical protein